MPVGASFRGFRRGRSVDLSCKSACGARVLTKKNCTATLTHIVSKLPCSYGGAEGGRTPVRRPDEQSISERSLRIDIPSARLPQTGYGLQ